MTREEHLLVIFCEECSEVAKETAKALRFGLNDKEPNQDLTNREKIAIEFNDLFAVMHMLVDDGIIPENGMLDIKAIEAKKQKVEKYLKYSNSVGK